MHYLWWDTETGGLNYKKHPVLTMYLAICDKDLNIIEDLDLKVKPESMEGLEIEQEALDVNGINIEEHFADPETIIYSEAKVKIQNMLSRHKIPRKRKSFRSCGHNIGFDEDFMIHYIMGEDWAKLVHHAKLDTYSGCVLLQEFGILPENLGSLTSLVEHFKIPQREAHRAKDDVLMNIEMYKAMKKMMSGKKQGMAGIDQNLLSIVEM